MGASDRQVVKERCTRDSYHDMKKAIMARLTTKEVRSGAPSINRSSSCVSLATMTSSCAAIGRPVFPMLSVEQFQGSDGQHTSYNVHGFVVVILFAFLFFFFNF